MYEKDIQASLCVVCRVGAKYFEKDLSKFQVQSQCTYT